MVYMGLSMVHSNWSWPHIFQISIPIPGARFCICYSIRSSNKMHGSPTLWGNTIEIKYLVWELSWYENFGLCTCSSFQDSLRILLSLSPYLVGEDWLKSRTDEQEVTVPSFGTRKAEFSHSNFCYRICCPTWDKSLASVWPKGTIPISSNSLHPHWVSPCSDKAKLTQVTIYCFTK